MGKVIRFAGVGLAVIVLLIVVAVVVLPLLVDPNDFKPQIASAVESSTGRQLTIEGDLELSVFPWLGVEIGETELANASGFSDRPFARVEEVQVRVKLMPLLRKTLEMDTVVLKGLRVSLETDAQGNTNLPELQAAEPTAPAAEPEPGAADFALAGMAIGGVEITDAALIWDDRQANARYEITDLALQTGAIGSGAAVPVRLRLHLVASEPAIAGPLDFKGTVTVSEDLQRIQMDDARLTADLAGEGLPGGRIAPRLAFNSTMDLEQETLNVAGLVLEVLDLKVEGALQGKNILGESAAFVGQLELHEFVPREVLKALGQAPLEVSDAAVLGKADGTLQLVAGKNSLSVPQLQVRLDDSTLTGELSVTDFERMSVRFDLRLDEIDVDRYLPPETEAAPVTPTGAAAAGSQMIPVETLRTLDINGKLAIGQLKAAQLRSTDILIQLVAQNGILRVHPARAKMYEGEYQGDLSLDVTGAQPRISMNERLAGVQLGPLLVDMLGKGYISGSTRATAKLTTAGQTPDEMTRNLNGDVAFALSDGAVTGFNLAAMLRSAKTLGKGEVEGDAGEPRQTDFTELSGTATVTNGVINNQDLSAKSPLLRVDGKGRVDLPQQTLDYLLTTKVVGTLEGQTGKGLEDLRGMAVPVQISGTFDDLNYSVRLDEALRGAAEAQIKEKVQEQEEKVKEKVQEKLEKKLGDSLKGLFQ